MVIPEHPPGVLCSCCWGWRETDGYIINHKTKEVRHVVKIRKSHFSGEQCWEYLSYGNEEYKTSEVTMPGKFWVEATREELKTYLKNFGRW